MGWSPANRHERELAWALAGGNLGRYFRAVTGAPLLVPQRAGAGTSPPADGDSERWAPATMELAGRTAIPAFTSEEGLSAVRGGETAGYLLTGYRELRDAWPDPEWWLALNPGLPIGAVLPVDAVTTAARGEPLPPDTEVEVARLGEPGDGWTPWPPGGPEEVLRDAVARGSTAEYLDALRSCQVVVPTSRPVSGVELPGLLAPGSAGAGDAGDGGFPWQPVGPPLDPTVEVFTVDRPAPAAYRDRPWVPVAFHLLPRVLPPGWALSVNPGGPAGLDLGPDEVPLVARWRSTEPVPAPVRFAMPWLREQVPRPPREPRRSGRPLAARSHAEVKLFLDLHPCENCGARRFSGRTAVVTVDGEPCHRYTGACGTCGALRTYTFLARGAGVEDTMVDGAPVFGGPEPSTLLDPGEWLALADLAAGGGNRRAPLAPDLALAAAAVDEVLKFLREGADRVSPGTLRTEESRRRYAREPERFRRERLVAEAAGYRDRVARTR